MGAGETISLEEQIRQGYLWILNREPDPVGLNDYVEAIQDGACSIDVLRKVLTDSEEYRASREKLVFVDVGGVKVAVDPDEREFGQTIAHHGAWEPHVIALIRESLSAGGVFVDVGANVGVMSMNAAAVVGPTGKVISIEPSPRNAAQFLRGVLVNGFQHVILHQVAASDRYGVIFTTRAANGKFAPTLDPMQMDNPTQTMPLDDILDREDRVDFIKLDIEGYEPLALGGLSRTLRRLKPTVLCEFSPVSLKGNDETWPERLVDLLFSYTSKIDCISSDGERITVRTPAALHELWRAKDAIASREGWLPDGWTHFDLLLQVE